MPLTVTDEVLSADTKDKNEPFFIIPWRRESISTGLSASLRVSSTSYAVMVFRAPSPRVTVRVAL